MAERGLFDCTLLAGHLGAGEGDMAYLADEAKVRVEVVPGLGPEPSPRNDLHALWWLYRRFRADRPHIVHTHTAKAGALGRLAAAMARVPVRIHTYHGHVLGGSYFGPTRTAFFRFVERLLGRLSTRLIVISPQQLTELCETHRVAESAAFACIPLGLDLERFRTVERVRAGSDTRASLGIAPDAWVVGTVGRLVPVKNHALLLRAFALVVGRRGLSADQARLLIVGDGSLGHRGTLRYLAAQLGLSDHIHWLGWRNDLPELLSAMDVFALTSDDEGTPVAVIEAVAAGTAVVARNVGGVSDVLSSVPNAVCVDSSDTDGFADALERSRMLVCSEEERTAVRRETARRFSPQRLTDDMAALYRNALRDAGIGL